MNQATGFPCKTLHGSKKKQNGFLRLIFLSETGKKATAWVTEVGREVFSREMPPSEGRVSGTDGRRMSLRLSSCSWFLLDLAPSLGSPARRCKTAGSCWRGPMRLGEGAPRSRGPRGNQCVFARWIISARFGEGAAPTAGPLPIHRVLGDFPEEASGPFLLLWGLLLGEG